MLSANTVYTVIIADTVCAVKCFLCAHRFFRRRVISPSAIEEPRPSAQKPLTPQRGVSGFSCAIFLPRRSEQVEARDHAREHDGDHREELDEDVDGRAGGILEGVAHGVADHGSLVLLAALAAVMAGLDILLGIVRRSSP